MIARVCIVCAPRRLLRYTIQRFLQPRASFSSSAEPTTTTINTMSASKVISPLSGGVPLRIVSFNMLAPCYFRRSDGSRVKRVEACFRHLYTARLTQQLHILKEIDADVICLQEFWFKPDVLALLRKVLGSDYAFSGLQRGGSKEDGLVILVKRGKWCIKETEELLFHDCKDRGVLLALLEQDGGDDGATSSFNFAGFSSDLSSLLSRPIITTPTSSTSSTSTTAQKRRQIIVANTHLTYPHDEFDMALRADQASRILSAIESFAAATTVTKSQSRVVSALREAAARLDKMKIEQEEVEIELDAEGEIPAVLAGDFNHDSDEAIERIRKAGFISAHAAAHGREAGITHIDHVGKMVSVDYIFVHDGKHKPKKAPASLSAAVQVQACHVMPTTVADTDEMKRPRVNVSAQAANGDTHDIEAPGDAAPVVSPLPSGPKPIDDLTWTEWSQLSDHRMIVAELELK